MRNLADPRSTSDGAGRDARPWHGNGIPMQPEPGLRERWQRVLGVEDPVRLERRLAWEDAPPAATESVDWWPWLEGLRAALRKGVDHPLEPPPTPRALGNCPRAFLDLWTPAVVRFVQELRRELSPSLTLSVSETAWRQLGNSLLDRLCVVAEPVLWESFNRIRGPGTLLLAQLGSERVDGGQPPRDLYAGFVRRHRGDGLESLLSEFPILARLLGVVAAFWREAGTELLLRVDRDLPDLARLWDLPEGVALTGIHQGLSDPHRGGREVATLRFGPEDGATRVVYKPKEMGLDAAFQELVRALDDDGSLPPLKTLRVLTRPGYGYMEHLPHRVCSCPEELERFYRNSGRLTAILHVLRCIDGHHENLIAHGDQLVLVDAETLLVPTIPAHTRHAAAPESADTSDEPSGLAQAIADSVLRCGLLPMWEFNGRSRLARDVSALGIASPAQATRRSNGLVDLNTDAMRVGVAETPCPLPTSLPVGIGEPNPFSRHLEVYLRGFEEQARRIAASREHWLGDGGLLERFAGLPRRLVLRPTQVYAVIQQQQLMPAALKSPETQGLVLEQLARMFLWARRRPRHWPVLAAELRQMEQLDVPYFAGATDGLDLPLLKGGVAVEGFLPTSGLEDCRRRLADLDERVIALQCRLVRGAVQARVLQVDEPAGAPVGSGPPAPAPTRPEREALIRRLAGELAALAIPDAEGIPEWLGLDLGADGGRYTFGPVGTALYGGGAGVALLQALLAREGRHDLPPADRILARILALGRHDDPAALQRWWRDQPLGLAGCGGVLLALLELDHLEAPPPEGFTDHRSLALNLLVGLPEQRLETDSDSGLDIIGGVAGLIGPLLGLGHPRALDLAVLAGDRLLRWQAGSGGWPQQEDPAGERLRPLTGFSHGAAGMAAALSRLAEVSGEERFRCGALRALDYERGCFDPAGGNWPDFRAGQSGQAFMSGWCHGAPGIALSRLCCRDSGLASPGLEKELEVALRTTASQMPTRDNLCCGSMGLVALLRLAGQVLGETRWTEAASRLEAKALARAGSGQGSFRMFGTQEGGVVLPGLMTGLSGIALVLVDTPAAHASLGRLLSAGLLGQGRAAGGLATTG